MLTGFTIGHRKAHMYLFPNEKITNIFINSDLFISFESENNAVHKHQYQTETDRQTDQTDRDREKHY